MKELPLPCCRLLSIHPLAFSEGPLYKRPVRRIENLEIGTPKLESSR